MEAIAARVLGKGRLGAEGQKSIDRWRRQNKNPCHQLGLWQQYRKWHHPQVSGGMMACLQRDLLPAATFEAPWKPLQLEVMMEPSAAMMCASFIVQDEAMGMMYMDTVTTSMGQVALGGPHLMVQVPGPTIEDITTSPNEWVDDHLWVKEWVDDCLLAEE